MPPAKLTYHVTLGNERHFLLMPLEELEPSYILVELRPRELSRLEEQFGPGPTWMEKIFWNRKLRQELPTQFRRSNCGDFGSIHLTNGVRYRGQIEKGFGLFFGSEQIPGTVVEVETYPERRPDTSLCRLDVFDSPINTRSTPSGVVPQKPLPDLLRVVRFELEGRKVVTASGSYQWPPKDRLEPERVTKLDALDHTGAYLVRALSGSYRYVAFFFTTAVILVCPVKANASFYRTTDGLKPQDLPELLTTKSWAIALGFERLFGQGAHLDRLVQVAKGEKPIWCGRRLKKPRAV